MSPLGRRAPRFLTPLLFSQLTRRNRMRFIHPRISGCSKLRTSQLSKVIQNLNEDQDLTII